MYQLAFHLEPRCLSDISDMPGALPKSLPRETRCVHNHELIPELFVLYLALARLTSRLQTIYGLSEVGSYLCQGMDPVLQSFSILIRVQALLRLTSQRLGQLQEKKDSKASITRRDIATVLQQGNVGLARAKAQNLIQEDGPSI
jgi:hypothetical protein